MQGRGIGIGKTTRMEAGPWSVHWSVYHQKIHSRVVAEMGRKELGSYDGQGHGIPIAIDFLPY